jgi:hypothetical protein
LSFAAWDGFNAAVDPRSQSPQKVYVPAITLAVETGRYDKQIDVAPLIGLPCGLRPKDHPETRHQPMVLQSLNVVSNDLYNRRINH